LFELLAEKRSPSFLFQSKANITDFKEKEGSRVMKYLNKLSYSVFLALKKM